MKLQDHEKVTKAIGVLKNIDRAIEQHGNFISAAHQADCGGVKGLAEFGYMCYFGIHKDNSGLSIDMSGCYVALEVAEAILPVLEFKKMEIMNWLKEHGVET